MMIDTLKNETYRPISFANRSAIGVVGCPLKCGRLISLATPEIRSHSPSWLQTMKLRLPYLDLIGLIAVLSFSSGVRAQTAPAQAKPAVAVAVLRQAHPPGVSAKLWLMPASVQTPYWPSLA
jgi:hypothetical protein